MFTLYSKGNSPRQIERVVRLLEDGGVIILPTDTVYAYCCHALKERAVERICKLRNIDPRQHPLSILCSDLSQVSDFCRISNAAFKLLRHNLPGAFTFILPATGRLPKAFHAGSRREVGIRMPKNQILREIIESLGAPLMTASLPIEDREPECRLVPELVEEEYGGQVDLVVDGGEGHEGHSTVVSCIANEPEVLREGDGELQY